MAKQRYVKDSFWIDPYVQELGQTEKLLFLYLLTNSNVNVAGIYEITEKQICFDTGIDKNRLAQAVDRLSKDGKIIYKDNWVIIINFIKNQSVNPSVEKGIERVLSDLPLWIKDRLGTGCIQAGTYSTLLNFTLLNSTENEIVEKTKELVKDKKLRFLNKVFLTEKEYSVLELDFGKKNVEDRIEALDEYIINKCKGRDPYSDHNLVIRKWIKKDGIKKKENKVIEPPVETDDFFNSIKQEIGCE